MCDFGVISGPVLAGIGSTMATVGSTAAGAAAGGTFLGLSATAWTGIGLASSLAGAAMQGIGQMQQGKAQQQAYKYNAKVQEVQAVDAERRGSIAEGQAQDRTRAVLGAVNARQGSSGVVAGEGTGGDVLAEVAEVGARDAATYRVNAAREAWGLRAGAAIDRQQGELARSAGNLRATGTFMRGVNTFANEAVPWWKRYGGQDDLNRGRDVDDLVYGMGY